MSGWRKCHRGMDLRRGYRCHWFCNTLLVLLSVLWTTRAAAFSEALLQHIADFTFAIRIVAPTYS